MRTGDVIRCYAQRLDDGQWEAFCLDLSLGAQGASLDEVKHKLNSQVLGYLHDAINGADQAHRAYLLPRRAPLKFWLRYWAIKAHKHLHASRERPEVDFKMPMPAYC